MNRRMTWTSVFLIFFAMTAALRADENTLSPSITVREEYNNNLFFDFDNEQDDFLTVIRGGLDFTNRTERRNFHVGASVMPFFYARRDDLDDIDAEGVLQWKYRWSPRFSSNVDGAFGIDNRPDRDVDITGLVFSTDRRYRYHGGLMSEYALREDQSVSFSYAYDKIDWDQEDTELEDYYGNAVSLGYRFDAGRWLRATALILNGGYGTFEYETSEVTSGYAVAGIEHMLSELFKLEINAGARRTSVEFDVSTIAISPTGGLEPVTRTIKDDTWGGIGNIGIHYSGERTTCRLTASHDLRTAGGSQGATNLSRFLLQLRYRLQEKLSVGLFSGYYINSADAGEFSAAERDEKTFSARPFLRWQFTDQIAAEAAYYYTRITNEIIDRDAERHTAYLQISYSDNLLE